MKVRKSIISLTFIQTSKLKKNKDITRKREIFFVFGTQSAVFDLF